MLPSFRLIVATFVCGFVMVFAGLRMAASPSDIRRALPVLAAHAAPLRITSAVGREDGRGIPSVPLIFDARFAVTPVPVALALPAPPISETPLPPPVSDVPSEDLAVEAPVPVVIKAEPAKEPLEPQDTLAAIKSDRPANPTGPDSPAAPMPDNTSQPSPAVPPPDGP
jgi:hypothetical protein